MRQILVSAHSFDWDHPELLQKVSTDESHLQRPMSLLKADGLWAMVCASYFPECRLAKSARLELMKKLCLSSQHTASIRHDRLNSEVRKRVYAT